MSEARSRRAHFVVQLFDGQGKLLASPTLHTVVRPFVQQLLGSSIETQDIAMTLYKVPANQEEIKGGTPLRNLGGDFGYMQLTVHKEGRTVYRHPHPIAEVIAEGLRLLLAELAPDASRVAAFAVRPADDLLDAAQLSQVVAELPEPSAHKPSFKLRRLPDQPLPVRRRSSFHPQSADQAGAAAPKDSGREEVRTDLHVYVAASVHAALTATQPLSLEVEEGGFLIGRAFADEERQGGYLVEVCEVVPAEHTGASLLHLTFTGDTFAALARRLQSAAGETRLLGWYHTHLFAASSRFGLSSVDVRLHHTTFGMPWHLAGLVNIEPTGETHSRVLRFYGRLDKTMARCLHEVLL